MNNKRFIIAAGIVLFVIILFFIFSPSEEVKSEILVSPEIGEFKVSVTATGELQAQNSVKIYGPMNARMAQIWQMKLSKLVPEGTVVKKGEFVAEIDPSEISNKIKDVQLEVQQAESKLLQTRLDTTLTLSQARDELVNLTYAVEEARLNKEQSTYEAPAFKRKSEIDYEKAIRALEQAEKNYLTKVRKAKTEIQQIQTELSKHKQKMDLFSQVLSAFQVVAPADGMVIYKKSWNGQKVTEGSMIQGWDPVVATLPDLSVMESITYVNEVDIKKIAEGQKVIIGLDADPDKSFTGTVINIANIGEQRPNSNSKVFEVKILVAESDSTLRPAMTTSNEIIVSTIDSAMHIPLECIHVDDSLTYVLKKNGSDIIKQEVELGIFNENSVTIVNGLNKDNELYLSEPPDTEELSVELLSRN